MMTNDYWWCCVRGKTKMTKYIFVILNFRRTFYDYVKNKLKTTLLNIFLFSKLTLKTIKQKLRTMSTSSKLLA